MSNSNSVYNFDIASIQQVQKKIESAIDNVRLARDKIYEAYSFADERLKDAYSNKGYKPTIYSALSSGATSESSAASILEKCITGGNSVISALDLVIGVEDTSALSAELSGINTETTVAADAVDTSTDGSLSDAVNAEIQDGVTAKWYDGYKEAWEKLKNFEIIDAIGAALSTLLKNVAATIAAAFTSLLNGIVSLGEGIVDAVAFIGGGIVSLGAWLFSGKEARDNILDAIKGFVAKDGAGSLYDRFYSTRLGQDIAENSVLDVNGVVLDVVKETGRWAGITLLQLIPGVGQAVAITAAASSGLGIGAQTALQNGSGYGGALLAGGVRGIIDGLMAGSMGSFVKNGHAFGVRAKNAIKPKSGYVAQYSKDGLKMGAYFQDGTLGAKIVNKARSILSKITPAGKAAANSTGMQIYSGYTSLMGHIPAVLAAPLVGATPAIVDTVVDKVTDAVTGGGKVTEDKQDTNTVVDETIDTGNLSDEQTDGTIVDGTDTEEETSGGDATGEETPSDTIVEDNDSSGVDSGVVEDSGGTTGTEDGSTETPSDSEDGEQESGSIEVETGDGSSETDGDEESNDETQEDGSSEDEEEEDESGTSSAGPTCLECGKSEDECTCEKDEESGDETEEPDSDQDSETETPIISGTEEITGNIGPGYSVPEDYVEPSTNTGSSSGSSSSGTGSTDVGTSTGTTETIEPPTGGNSAQLGTIEVTTDNVGSGIEIGESESGMFTYNDHISGTALLDEITDDVVIGEGSSIIEGMDGIGQIDVTTTTEYDHEAYEKARTSYENLGTEWHARQENLIVNEVDELYVTDQATLGEKLLAYGYSQEEVDTILQDKNMAYRAMIAGYDNSNIEKIRENFSQTPELADSVDVTTIIE